MNNISFDTMVALATAHEDPIFFAAKSALRREFPGAHMIELAEGCITIVTDQETVRVSVH